MTTKTLDIMMDIETLGTNPGAPIVQISAKVFDRTTHLDDWLSPHFDAFIDLQSCLDLGLDAITADTLQFWFSQDTAVGWKVLFNDHSSNPRLEIKHALEELFNWSVDVAESNGVEREQIIWWAKGPDFDMVLVEAACNLAGVEVPWRYNKKRDLRTVQDVTGLVDDVLDDFVEPPQDAHDAMVDVEHQINQLRFCLGRLDLNEIDF